MAQFHLPYILVRCLVVFPLKQTKSISRFISSFSGSLNFSFVRQYFIITGRRELQRPACIVVLLFSCWYSVSFCIKKKETESFFFFLKYLRQNISGLFSCYIIPREERGKKKMRCCTADVQQFTVLHIERNFVVVFVLLCFQEIETRISGPSRHKFLYNNTVTHTKVYSC